jgi:SAM-dependent methyltransferase
MLVRSKEARLAVDDLKQKQRTMWGAGPFERIEPNLGEMHATVVERLGARPGERWLDIGCGTGGAAFLAAEAGADVTGLDLSPVLIETARERAAERGLELRLDAGDAESLPYGDASFDVVCSTVGIMFAPDQEAAAAELARVCRPGGRIGIASWRAEGAGGELFRVMAPFQPPPPPGLVSPFEWGREDGVQRLIADAFDLRFEEQESAIEAPSADAVWEVFSTSFGPLKTLAASLEPDRREELHEAFVEFFDRYPSNGGIRQPRTYLIALGTRR